MRAAERDPAGRWRVNAWVKEEILRIFQSSPLVAFGNSITRELWPFVDSEPSTALGRAEANWLAAHPHP